MLLVEVIRVLYNRNRGRCKRSLPRYLNPIGIELCPFIGYTSPLVIIKVMIMEMNDVGSSPDNRDYRTQWEKLSAEERRDMIAEWHSQFPVGSMVYAVDSDGVYTGPCKVERHNTLGLNISLVDREFKTKRFVITPIEYRVEPASE